MARTFDDGPHPPSTGRIIDVLDAYAVTATFFCVGLRASGHGEELARMRESGHRVGNHTWSNPSWRRDGCFVRLRFRAPDVFAHVRDHPATTVVLWDVDTADWAMPGADAIASSATDQARPGSIVLMHDGGRDRSQTVEALPSDHR